MPGLYKALRAQWPGFPEDEDGVRVHFQRGMIHLLVRVNGIAKHGDFVRKVLCSGWVERLALTGDEDQLGELARWPECRVIPWLALSITDKGGRGPGGFLACLPQLQRLELAHIGAWEGAAEVLVGLERLTWLSWEGFGGLHVPHVSPVTVQLVEALRPLLRRCRVLRLAFNDSLGDEGLAALLDSLGEEMLRELDLGSLVLSAAGIERLAACDRLGGLRALRLGGDNQFGDQGAAILASAVHLGQLAYLGLSAAGLQEEGVQTLAASPILARVQTLDLSYNPIGSAGAHHLASSNHLGNLKRLWLFKCQISAAGARALVQSDRLTSLVEVDLEDNPIAHVGWRDGKLSLEEWRRLCALPEADRSPDTVRRLCDLLSNGPPYMRRGAAATLARLWWERQDDLSAEVETGLAGTIDDPADPSRTAPSDILKNAAPADALPRLLELLDTCPSRAKAQLSRLVSAVGSSAWQSEEVLLAHIEQARPLTQEALVKTLAAIEASSPRAIEVYRHWLAGERGAAAHAAAQLARLRLDLDAVVALWRQVAARSDEYARPLAGALGGWPDAFRRVLGQAADPRPRVRAAVAEVLGYAAPIEEVVAALARLLDDPEDWPRLRACLAVRRSGHRALAFVAPLGRCVAEPFLQASAVQALRLQGPDAAAATPVLLHAAIEDGHVAALLLLRDLGEATRPHAAAFREALLGGEAQKQRRARVALRHCAPHWPDAAALLAGWLGDACGAVARAAAAELSRLATTDASAQT